MNSLRDRLLRGLLERQLDTIHELLPDVHATLAAPPDEPLCPQLLDYISRCMDLDGSLVSGIEDALSRTTASENLSLKDATHLDIATGLLNFHQARFDVAYQRFEDAVRLARRTSNRDLVSIALYYLARTAWRKGEYSKALLQVEEAKCAAHAGGFVQRLSLIEMLEAWLHVLRGDFEMADSMVARIGSDIEHSSDHLTKGDILSYRGRRARHSGTPAALSDARRLFENAIREYSKFDPGYRNIGRCHANIAYVCYLQIRALNQGRVDASVRQACEHYRAAAFEHCDAADRIYSRFSPERTRKGRAKLLHHRALLHTVFGESEQAATFAELAYAIAAGQEPSADAPPNGSGSTADADRAMMADAKIIISMAALDQDRAMKALLAAREAVGLAETTENRRLKARARVWLGFALLHPSINNALEADELHSQAQKELAPEARRRESDYLLSDLSTLRDDIDRADNGDSCVYSLTGGRIRGRILRTILRDVSKEVIHYVYVQNDGDQKKTAEELGINPEKVRNAVGPGRKSTRGSAMLNPKQTHKQKQGSFTRPSS